MRWWVAFLAGVMLVATGCTGGETSSPATTQSSGPPVRGCRLSLENVRRVSGIEQLRRVDLAPVPALRLLCSTVFVGPNGELVLHVTEATGGTARLTQVRQERAIPGVKIQKLTGFGDEAFVANGRFLAFSLGQRVIMIETAPGVLTLEQLEELGRMDASG